MHIDEANIGQWLRRLKRSRGSETDAMDDEHDEGGGEDAGKVTSEKRHGFFELRSVYPLLRKSVNR
jgi:hypothetical protein